MFAADTFFIGEEELIPGFQVHGAAIYFAHTKLGALKVGKDGYVEGEIVVDTVDVLDDLLVLGMGAMGEIEAEYIDPSFYKGK
jgi:hypothetical protein